MIGNNKQKDINIDCSLLSFTRFGPKCYIVPHFGLNTLLSIWDQFSLLHFDR